MVGRRPELPFVTKISRRFCRRYRVGNEQVSRLELERVWVAHTRIYMLRVFQKDRLDNISRGT